MFRRQTTFFVGVRARNGVHRSPAFAGAALPAVGAALLWEPRRGMNMNRHTQGQWNKAYQDAPKVTDYDFDKERLGKQMKIASMDCIMDPDITVPKKTTWSGIKKMFRQWLTMKKLRERRPTFDPSELRELYERYETLAHSRNPDDIRMLHRVTTHSEAQRLQAANEARVAGEFGKKSWKSLQLNQTKSEFEMKINSFDIISCYFGQLTKDDWVQLTVKVDGQRRNKASEEFQRFVEYPVLEMCLGDGVKSTLANPFIVVGVLNKDGVRYGKDGQDASELRKNISRASRSWF